MTPAYSACVWLFNVEGTLAVPGGPAEEAFTRWFIEFSKRHDVRLLSELDYPRIERLLGSELTRTVRTCYATRGNSVWIRGERLHELRFEPPAAMLSFLQNETLETLFPMEHESSVCLEHGVLRLKVLGEAPDPEDVASYAEWDRVYQERRTWAKEIASAFPHFEAEPVAEHFIDIFPLGRGKAQVLEHIGPPVLVVGQCMNPHSNDFWLGRAACERKDGSRCFNSTTWSTTLALLQSLLPGQR